MARKAVHHLDFETLVNINKGVVALTGEPNEYSTPDGQKLTELVREVEQRADNQDFDEAVPEKAALLVFKLASGQYFRAGNKRTALVTGLVFLAKNGFRLDITDAEFVSTVDRSGIGAAGLDDVYGAVRRLAVRSAVERKGWDKAVISAVESQKAFLSKMGS